MELKVFKLGMGGRGSRTLVVAHEAVELASAAVAKADACTLSI